MFTPRNVFLKNSRNLKRLFSVKINKDHATVTIEQGKLQGKVNKLFNGTSYFSFKGIPYAEPPLGQQRFKAPRRHQGWQGTRDATKHGPVCPQYDIHTSNLIEGNEDCLFLNVYTKSLTNSKLPVMVYIHGGAFASGSGDSSTYGPQFLLQHDVLLVTLNYRLEALGFLCLDTPEVPGNAGMKDQVAALQWVRENIEKFGGDPDNVTLFGQSAGAASVTYHMLSDMSKGLFHKAIAQSGMCNQDWAIDIDPVDRAFRIGKELGIDTVDKDKLLKHLRSLKATDLAKITLSTRTFDEKHRGLPIFLAPVVEKQNTTDHFITKDAVDLLAQKQVVNNVPLIIGYTSGEGIFPALDILKKADYFNKDLTYLLPKEIVHKVTQEKLTEFGERLKEFYCKGKDIGKQTMGGIINYQTDRLFAYNCNRFANFYDTVAPTYMYRFDCDTELNFVKNTFRIKANGACHADDIYYLFSNKVNKQLYEKQDNLRDIVNKMTTIWTDFAKTGNPTPDNNLGVKWEPFTPTEEKCLEIKEGNIKMADRPDRDRFEFWNKIYQEAGLHTGTKE